MSSDAGGEKSFEPTDLRREEFKKQGRFAHAKDLGGLAATAGALGTVAFGRERIVEALEIAFRHTIGDLGMLERLGPAGALRSVFVPVLEQLAPVLGGAAVLAVVASGSQTRFRLNFDAIGWKPERLDPVAGLGRVFAIKKNFVQLLLAIARVTAVGAVAYGALKRELPSLLGIARAPAAAAGVVASGSMTRVVVAVLVGLGIVAAIDYAWSWFSLEQEMRMTRQERIDEAKQQEGDPKAKGRMKARARANAKRRAMAGVKNADVIVTNPTHVAVALRYGPKDAAPIVVAKGHDEIALRIRAEGRKYGIPILENRSLARALDAQVPVGKTIPQAYFAAVAQVLAFVYRLKKRGQLGGTRRA